MKFKVMKLIFKSLKIIFKKRCEGFYILYIVNFIFWFNGLVKK